MDNGKLFELAVVLAAPQVAAMNKQDRGNAATYEDQAAAEIQRCYRIVKAASKAV